MSYTPLGNPPAYGMVTRAYRASLRPVVVTSAYLSSDTTKEAAHFNWFRVTVAIFTAIWTLIWAVCLYGSPSPDDSHDTACRSTCFKTSISTDVVSEVCRSIVSIDSNPITTSRWQTQTCDILDCSRNHVHHCMRHPDIRYFGRYYGLSSFLPLPSSRWLICH